MKNILIFVILVTVLLTKTTSGQEAISYIAVMPAKIDYIRHPLKVGIKCQYPCNKKKINTVCRSRQPSYEDVKSRKDIKVGWLTYSSDGIWVNNHDYYGWIVEPIADHFPPITKMRQVLAQTDTITSGLTLSIDGNMVPYKTHTGGITLCKVSPGEHKVSFKLDGFEEASLKIIKKAVAKTESTDTFTFKPEGDKKEKKIWLIPYQVKVFTPIIEVYASYCMKIYTNNKYTFVGKYEEAYDYFYESKSFLLDLALDDLEYTTSQLDVFMEQNETKDFIRVEIK